MGGGLPQETEVNVCELRRGRKLFFFLPTVYNFLQNNILTFNPFNCTAVHGLLELKVKSSGSTTAASRDSWMNTEASVPGD